MRALFHLAFATSNFSAIKKFYGEILNLTEGRSGSNWVDYDFFGHQLTIQEVLKSVDVRMNYRHPKSGLPLNHFGVILNLQQWKDIKRRLEDCLIIPLVEERVVMQGEVGEQRIIMFQDPDGNVLEFKTFLNESNVFSRAE